MKKILIISMVLIAVSVGAFAQGIELGEFPLGKWVDENYDAYWEFSSNNIRILDADGGVYYDFRGKTITNFKVSVALDGITLKFSCAESGRDYEFLKPPTNLDLEMTIDTEWGENYKTDLPFKS